MAIYAVTDSEGNILRQGSCPKKSVQHQAGAGELAFLMTQCLDDVVDIIDTDTGEPLIDAKVRPDPLARMVSAGAIKAAYLEIMQYPVAAEDGKVFDFDRDSRALMEGAITALTEAGGSVDWRLYDNSTVSVDAAGLQVYLDQLRVNQAMRGLAVDPEYVALKVSGATVGEIKDWKLKYRP